MIGLAVWSRKILPQSGPGTKPNYRPYFGVALQCLPGTELVFTLTNDMTSVVKRDRRLRVVKAPQELQSFHFLMAWHSRLNSDHRHVWLREAMRSTVAAPNV